MMVSNIRVSFKANENWNKLINNDDFIYKTKVLMDSPFLNRCQEFGGSNSYGGGSFAFLVFLPYQRFCVNSASILDLWGWQFRIFHILTLSEVLHQFCINIGFEDGWRQKNSHFFSCFFCVHSYLLVIFCMSICIYFGLEGAIRKPLVLWIKSSVVLTLSET